MVTITTTALPAGSAIASRVLRLPASVAGQLLCLLDAAGLPVPLCTLRPAGTGDAVPLAGTAPGAPVTGELVFSDSVGVRFASAGGDVQLAGDGGQLLVNGQPIGGPDPSLSFTYDTLALAATTTWDVTDMRHAAAYVDLQTSTTLELLNGQDGFVGTVLVLNTTQNPLSFSLPAGEYGPKNYSPNLAAGERRMVTCTYAHGTWYFNSAIYYPL